ncbi:MAG: hypothetical protein FJ147_27035 [Deltaproteobacteria bacterium]|nr:hypothetical protein [Deltaproteobacteria bacterium]
MAGIDHTIVTVNNFEQAGRFYSWLMPKIGYSGGEHDYGAMKGWMGKDMSFWIKKADQRFATDTFHKDRVGLCEIAFKGDSRAQIDTLGGGRKQLTAIVIDRSGEPLHKSRDERRDHCVLASV